MNVQRYEAKIGRLNTYVYAQNIFKFFSLHLQIYKSMQNKITKEKEKTTEDVENITESGFNNFVISVCYCFNFSRHFYVVIPFY